ARRGIAAAIQSFGPEVMHAHLARAAYIAGKARNNLPAPLAVKTHNYVDLKYYRDVDWFIPTTRDQRDYLVAHGVNADRIEVIPNFSALPARADDTLERALPTVPTFGAMGRLVRKKGFDILITAFKDALDRGLNASLVIGGDGPERERLEALIARLGCSEHVQLCGWVNDAGAFLSGIDVFVLPSLDEPFGIVVLEAMAKGRTIISTRTQGPLEILDDTTALLVDRGDTAQLTEAMLSVAADPAAALARARNGLERFRESFAQERVVPRLVDLYQRMASASAQ
ncbi:MAG: glycosyltransferase, partial [Gammaproteobacteria bacterium]|nr:glycosyltransferase [Gammaproteobacteria bacterium]